MEHDLILARSVTFAQRMQKALERNGIRCRIFRAPRVLTDLGCAYTVQISSAELGYAMHVLRGAGLPPLQVFRYQAGQYREVAV